MGAELKLVVGESLAVARTREVARPGWSDPSTTFRTEPMPLWLGRVIGQLAEAVVVIDRYGRRIVDNHEVLVADEPERHLVEAEVKLVLAQLAAQVRMRDPRGALNDVTTASQRYRLRGVVVPGLDGEECVYAVLLIERLMPRLPTIGDARAKCGLTAREAEVALLLAQGLRNADIAMRLGVSVHTARHHTENTMRKLGINSRDDVRRVLQLVTRPSAGA